MFSDTLGFWYLGWCWLEGWTIVFILLWGCGWQGELWWGMAWGCPERLLADLQMNESSDLF